MNENQTHDILTNEPEPNRRIHWIVGHKAVRQIFADEEVEKESVTKVEVPNNLPATDNICFTCTK